MKTKPIHRSLILVFSALFLPMMPLCAENVFITGWKGTSSGSDQTPPPLSVIDAGFAPAGAGGASASQVSPVPVIPNNARRIHYGRAPGATWSLTPTDMTVTPTAPAGTGPYTFTALQNIGVYKIYLTKGQDNNASTNIVVAMTASGGDLADTNGVAATSISLDMFQKGKPNHVWVHVGYITNTTLSPTITLTHIGGEINDTDGANANAQRWYTDAIRFEFLDQCAGVANQVSVGGPLVQGQTFVNVKEVAAGATNVTVFANGSQVGQTNNAAGFAAGNLTVKTTVPLNKGERITAGQTKGGCDSIIPGTGPTVGSGPNAQIRAFLSCWQNSSLAGPVGANTTTGLTNAYMLKATGLISAFGTAPTGGETLSPDQCWKTAIFDHAVDPGFTFTGIGLFNSDPFCALEGLVFSIDDTESGPYNIYVDQIKNGDTVIEDFEGSAAGVERTFTAPKNATGSTAPSAVSTYLSDPNSSLVSQANAFDGTNSCQIQWQWSDDSNIRWAHIVATNTSGKIYPQLDVTKPITVRYLVLPAGETTNKLHFPVVPVNQTKTTNGTVTFNVTAAGEGPFTYQWQFAAGDISGETLSSYTKSNLQLTDDGVYSVVVTGNGGAGCSATTSAKLTVTETVPAPTLNYSVSGGQITLTWTGNFTLQSSTNVLGPWNNITTTSGYAESVHSSTAKFFQLHQ